MSAAVPLRRFWRSPRLWVRLALGFGALLAMMIAVVVLAITQFRALSLHSEQMMRHGLQRILQVQEIDQHVLGHGSAMARLLTSPRSERETIYPTVDAEYAAIERVMSDLTRQTADAQGATRLQALSARRKEYLEAFIEIVTAIESGEVAAASALFNGAGQSAMKALIGASKQLLAHEQLGLHARQDEVQRQIERAEWLLAALALAAVALSVMLAWRTTLSVARPLERVEQAAARMAAGDYSAHIEVRSGDELGRVAKAMNTLASAVAAREAEIENVAYVDRLTGLPNRTLLRRLASDKPGIEAAVLLMDVARLRTVNEVLGFETGDALLVQVAQRLRAALGQDAEEADLAGSMTLARMPGGVFALLCPALSRAAVERLRERLEAAASGAWVCDGHPVDVHLVFGLADAADEPTLTIDGLLRRAELAVGDAKRHKRSWVWHAPADDAARSRQLSLLSSLQHAASSGELEMWLQPKHSLHSGRLMGMEALVRWRHPEHGYVSPAEFIPFAEKTGHIGQVTSAMITMALQALVEWAPHHPDLSIAVNVSALDVRDASFADHVKQLAQQHRAPLHRLRLEITESSVMEDADSVLPVLHALRALGVQLSIDDFGTGYSSLAYLHRLPVNELKIDRSFVAGADRHAEARALLKTIIDLGHSLKMSVTAEGIERPEERDLLATLGCDVAQGYLIARPLAPEAARRYLAALAAADAEQALLV